MDQIKILIVEDEPIIAADLEDRLQGMGYEVFEPQESGEAALQLLQRELPDLILMDVELDGQLDGIETAQRINREQAIPIIYLTSNSDKATFERARATRPAAFLSKPFRGRDLQHAIVLALANYHRGATAGPEEPPPPAEEETAILLNDRLFVRSKERLVRLFIKDIQVVEAAGSYCKIITAEREFLLSMTLKNMLERTDAHAHLIRVHRSHVVNILEIEEIGELYLFIGKKKIPIGRSYRQELFQRLKLL